MRLLSFLFLVWVAGCSERNRAETEAQADNSLQATQMCVNPKSDLLATTVDETSSPENAAAFELNSGCPVVDAYVEGAMNDNASER